ncbi:hypothetical protein [Streptomyces sp. NPDC003090]|uniref:hypothetical protein n=1 Tax=Streptomyces sp. NPDC003090 TaxID=3154274 RepID=UPI0037FE6B78
MDDDTRHQPAAGTGYPRGQLAKALATARTHPDPATRDRAGHRARQWRDVLDGMASGSLAIGSPTPAGWPAWITPEVVRGGFATGSPAAGGPLTPHETDTARRAGIPAERAALFRHHLTGPGLRELWALLDSGRYTADLPEETALLTVAWLVRAGDLEAAARLVRELEPYADRLRFTPRPSPRPAPADGVHRGTLADATASLERRRPHAAVETQREALTVWRPFADELLAHWLLTAGPDGVRVLERAPGPAWLERGAALLDRYERLAATHTRCAKHRRPKENAAMLRAALEDTVAGRALDARRLGLLRHAVASMVRRRGLPGSPEHTALRRRQAEEAARPSHHALARLVLRRLAGLPGHTGLPDPDAYTGPVTVREAEETGIPAGTALPPAVRRPVETAMSAPLRTLVERGIVPSGEILARLASQLVAAVHARACPDEALGALAAAHHRAFQSRRSLLLLDLARQTRPDDLPWARALAPHRGGGAGRDDARAALRELAELAVEAFPGTLLPNPLIWQFGHLARQAELEAPFTEELAADIFTGTFTPKFASAAAIAADLLEGTLYERYYGIDYAAVRALAAAHGTGGAGSGGSRGQGTPRTAGGFARLCHERAGVAGRSWSPAANGTVIEQAQILTTHNLATLVHVVGAAPQAGPAELARRCLDDVRRLTGLAARHPRPLRLIKNAAYAWRHLVFHLSLCPPGEQAAFLDEAGLGEGGLTPALAGLHLVAAGGSFGADGTAARGRARRFLGWTTERHWLTAAR